MKPIFVLNTWIRNSILFCDLTLICNFIQGTCIRHAKTWLQWFPNFLAYFQNSGCNSVLFSLSLSNRFMEVKLSCIWWCKQVDVFSLILTHSWFPSFSFLINCRWFDILNNSLLLGKRSYNIIVWAIMNWPTGNLLNYVKCLKCSPLLITIFNCRLFFILSWHQVAYWHFISLTIPPYKSLP